MHARLPGAPTPDEFRDLLAAGTDAVGEIPAERWPLEGFFEPGTLSNETGCSDAK
ncbi:beta-ketoacyl synthase N-terminal-like domain-containing protein [Azospirillum melinis]